MILARHTTKIEMGVYAGFSFTYSLFQTVGALGLNVAAVRFVAKLWAEKHVEEASAAAKTVIENVVMSAIALSVVYYLCAPYFSLISGGTFDYFHLFRAASLAVLVTIPSLVVEGLLQGIQEFGKLVIIRVGAQAVRIAVSTWLLLSGYGLMAVVAGWLMFGSILTLFPIPFIVRHINLRGSYPFKPILTYSLPLLGSSVLLFSSHYVDLFMIMVYGTPTELGAYNVVITASGVLTLVIIGPLITTLLPAMARSCGTGGTVAVERAFFKATRYVALIYAPAACGLAALAPEAISLMAGASYLEAVVPLVIISISSLAFAFANLIAVALQAVAETARVFRMTIVAVVADAAVCFILIPRMGMVSGSVGRAIFFLVMLGGGIYEARTVLNLKFDVEAAWKFTLASIAMATSIVLSRSWCPLWTFFPLYIGLGLLAYVLALRGLRAVREEDFRMTQRMTTKRLRWIRTLQAILT